MGEGIFWKVSFDGYVLKSKLRCSNELRVPPKLPGAPKQLGCINFANVIKPFLRSPQKLPKVTPEDEKTNVEKQDVFRLDFFMVSTWF